MILENRKRRSDASLNKLTGEQRQTVDDWLFDERLPYAEILARLETEFGQKSSYGSLSRYYRWRAMERQHEEILDARETVALVNESAGDTSGMVQAVMHLTGKAALATAIERPDQLATLVSLGKVLLQREQNDLRRARLAQVDRQFSHAATLGALKEMPQFAALLAALDSDAKLSVDQQARLIEDFLFEWKRQRELGPRGQAVPRETETKEPADHLSSLPERLVTAMPGQPGQPRSGAAEEGAP